MDLLSNFSTFRLALLYGMVKLIILRRLIFAVLIYVSLTVIMVIVQKGENVATLLKNKYTKQCGPLLIKL